MILVWCYHLLMKTSWLSSDEMHQNHGVKRLIKWKVNTFRLSLVFGNQSNVVSSGILTGDDRG